jgi:hypothetical protein
MNEIAPPEQSADAAAPRRTDIERLYLEGYASREIARMLNVDGNLVGRNVREIRRRWGRAAARQQHALSRTQCATVYREAMQGWQRSQDPKLTTTEENKTGEKAGNSARTVTRREQGPGDKTFLLAAVNALKALRQLAADQPDNPPTADDAVILALLQVLTREQVSDLRAEQLQLFRQTVDKLRKQFNERKRKVAACPAAEADRAEETAEPAPDREAEVS